MNGRELVSWNLRRLRTALELSQESLATDAGVERAYVGRIENSRVAATVDVLERLARALNVPIAELLAERKPGAKKPEPLPRGRRPAKRPRRKS